MKPSFLLRAGFTLLLSTSLLTACETNDVAPDSESATSSSSAKSGSGSSRKGGGCKTPKDTTKTSTSTPS